LIGYEQLPKKIKRLEQLESRISQHVQFQPADFDDIQIMATELVEGVHIAPCLLQDLLSKSKGNFRRITVGLVTIEKFSHSNGIKTITSEQWANAPFFPVAEV
jgi:hypothetical protein